MGLLRALGDIFFLYGQAEWVESRNLTWENSHLRIKVMAFPIICLYRQCLLREGRSHARTKNDDHYQIFSKMHSWCAGPDNFFFQHSVCRLLPRRARLCTVVLLRFKTVQRTLSVLLVVKLGNYISHAHYTVPSVHAPRQRPSIFPLAEIHGNTGVPVFHTIFCCVPTTLLYRSNE